MPIPIDFTKLSPQDVLEIAAFIEHEAMERYETFAAHLEVAGDRGAAAFFLTMAELEGAHGARISARRVARFADLPVTSATPSSGTSRALRSTATRRG